MATGNETGVLTSSVNQRDDYNLPVWEHLITYSYDDDDAGVVTVAVPINGVLLKIVFTVPVTNATGTTSQLLIKDNGDNTIFDSGELAENVTYTFNLFEPLSGTIDFVYEPSTAATVAAVTPTVRIRGI